MQMTRSITLLTGLAIWILVVAGYGHSPHSSSAVSIPSSSSRNGSHIPAVGGVQFDSRFSSKFISDEPQSANFKWQAGGKYRIDVMTTGGQAGAFGDLTPSELWCAYNLIVPSEELVKLYKELANPEEYRGLVTAASGGTSAEVNLHPVLRGTPVGKSAAQLDLLVAWMQNPSSNPGALRMRLQSNRERPIQWDTYEYSRLIWYDAELLIRVVDGQISVEPVDRPAETVMRIRFWQGDENGHDEFYGSHSHLTYLFDTFRPLRDIDRLCRCVAVLRWLQRNKCLPVLPTSVIPARVIIPDVVQLSDFME